MSHLRFSAPLFLAVTFVAQAASAVRSAELYTRTSYQYGRIEARIRFAPGDGVVSSFFLWKDGSEIAGTYWNELDFEKLGATCFLETNALFGKPVAGSPEKAALQLDLCGAYHTYTYEWTPEYIAWFVDETEIRRETGATATAYAENATAGMQIRFNIWPGDATFGGNFNPNILPTHQYIDWVQYSSYADGAFTMEWREDFNGATVPQGWLTGSWGSPKNLSTHDSGNVNFIDGYAVLSLTSDTAVGPTGADPEGSWSPPGSTDEDDSDDGCSVSSVGANHSNGLLGALGVLAGLALGRVRLLSRKKRAHGEQS
ncbi:MAG TPA: family 16 glycosylhydrolase [Polyangiaceae bacterium]